MAENSQEIHFGSIEQRNPPQLPRLNCITWTGESWTWGLAWFNRYIIDRLRSSRLSCSGGRSELKVEICIIACMIVRASTDGRVQTISEKRHVLFKYLCYEWCYVKSSKTANLKEYFSQLSLSLSLSWKMYLFRLAVFELLTSHRYELFRAAEVRFHSTDYVKVRRSSG